MTDDGTTCQKESTEGGTGRESPNSPTVRLTLASNVGTRPATAGNEGCPGNITGPTLCTDGGVALSKGLEESATVSNPCELLTGYFIVLEFAPQACFYL